MREHLVRVWRKSPFEPEETADRTRLGERHQFLGGEGKTIQYNKHPTISERNPSNYTIPYEQPLDNNVKKKAILIWRNLSFANHLPALFSVLEDINIGKLNLSEEGWGTLTTVMFKSDVYTVAVGVMYRSVFVCVILTRKRWTTESRKGRAGFLI